MHPFKIILYLVCFLLYADSIAQDTSKYFGGSYDGFVIGNISQSTLAGPVVGEYKYQGGSYDGFTFNDISQTLLGGSSINLAKYYGGSYDGFAFTLSSNIPLHITLQSFTSSERKNNVFLNWTTSFEINNRGFEVQRLRIGENWSGIGFVISKGSLNIPHNYYFEDKKLNSGKYKYRLKQIDFNGGTEYFNLEDIIEVGIPKDFYVSQNYPNPSNLSSKIDIEIPVISIVSIKLFDLLGREVKTILNEELKEGYYTISLDSKDLSSGIYFYKFKSGTYTAIKKIVLIK